MTEAKQRAALADVEKRNRLGGWSHNPKVIPHAVTYLNQERWDDDWQSELKPIKEDVPNSGPYIPPVRIPEQTLSWEERMFNRLGKNYIFLANGLPEVDGLKEIKRNMMLLDVPAFREETTSRTEVALELANAFLSRLDAHYGKTLKERVKRLCLQERSFGKRP